MKEEKKIGLGLRLVLLGEWTVHMEWKDD